MAQVLEPIMAHHHELQQRRITESEVTEAAEETGETEAPDQPVVRVERRADRPATTEVRPPVKKFVPVDRPPNSGSSESGSRSKPKIAYESETSQGPVEESGVSTAIPGDMERETDREYEPAAGITDLDREYQAGLGDEADLPELALAMAGAADEYFPVEWPPEFLDVDIADIDGAEILPAAEAAAATAWEPGRAEADVLGEDEVIFDDEVMAAYEQLVALIDLGQEEAKLTTAPEPYETFMQGETVLLNGEIIEPVEASGKNDFAELVATKPQPEEAPDIETIIAGANNQTLEETLVQLSFYLTEADQAAESSGIEAVLKEVVAALPHRSIGYANQENEEDRTAVTPELTRKLLVLLRAVGYDDPQEVLVEFVRQHDFEFLLQAIRYLYQLIDDNNRPEFSPIRTLNFTAMKVDEPLIARLGQAIMQYFFMRKMAPEL
jgi:hypothetical protein